MSQWWVRIRGRVAGPFTERDVRERLENEDYKGHEECSADGRNWGRLDQVPEFATDDRPRRRKPPPLAEIAEDVTPRPGGRGRPNDFDDYGRPPAGSRGFKWIVGSLAAVLVVGVAVAVVLLVRGGKRDADQFVKTNDQLADGKRSVVNGPGDLPDLTEEEVAVRVTPSIGLIEGNRGSGTGFVVKPRLIATNAHVIGTQFAIRTKIRFGTAKVEKDRSQLPIRVVHFDPRRDLALLEVDTVSVPLQIVGDYNFRRGQKVLALGNPGFAGGNLENAISPGLMSARTELDGGVPYFQISAAINGGNSGGPLVNYSGQVVGVIAAKAIGKEGMAFAIPPGDLVAAIAKYERQSADDNDRVAVYHQTCVAYYWLNKGCKLYAQAQADYFTILETAVRNNADSGAVLREMRGKLETKVTQVSKFIREDLNANLGEILNSKYCPDEAQKGLSELLDCYSTLKQLFDSPPSSLRELLDKWSRTVDRYKIIETKLNARYGGNE